MKYIAISVVMTVYNAEQYLKEAIDSILNQSFKNFEFIIVNDGSTDRSEEIISSYKDIRIRLINNKKNIGQAMSLNKGIEASKGKYIARMDADDISLTNRFEKQYKYMEKNVKVGICGTNIQILGSNKDQPINTSFNSLKILFFFGRNQIVHPTVMIRKSVLLSNNLLFNNNNYVNQDYELWVDSYLFINITNMPDVTLHYRKHEAQISSKRNDEQQKNINLICLKQLKYLNIKPNNEEKKTHLILVKNQIPKLKCDISKLKRWAKKLYKTNNIIKIFEPKAFKNTIHKKVYIITQAYFYETFINQKKYFPIHLIQFYFSKHYPFKYFSLALNIKFVLKCLFFYKNKRNSNMTITNS